MTQRITGVRRRRWPDEIYRRAQALLDNAPDLSQAAVADALAVEFDPAPAAKTIGDWLAKDVIRRPDVSELWSFSTTASPEDAGVVLTVLGELWDAGVWPNALSRAEAGHIARLRRAVPDLPAVRALALARAYLVAADAVAGRHVIYTVAGLDRYLAFAPWRDGAIRYINALREGQIREYLEMPGDPSSQEVRAMLRGPKETLGERAKRFAAERKAGLNPLLDGRPYRPEDKR